MKLIGNLLLTISLITGSLSAATSYLTPTSHADAAGIMLGDSAGAVAITPEALAKIEAEFSAGTITSENYITKKEALDPIVEKPANEEVSATEEDIAQLVATDVKYLHTKEFSWTRWPHAWVFGLSAAGLLTGSLLVRAGAKAEIAKSAPAEGSAEHHTGSPVVAMTAIGDALNSLKADLPGMPSDADRLKAIMHRLGELQVDQITTFVDARPQLIAKGGLGKYAEIMDNFAGMERKINRAWSAAADNHLPESSRSLDDAISIAPEVSALL